ncbi:MAG: hypothetical protein Q8N35_02770 [Methylococcaceae bacterium]|jgi:hypothetical protein|nr:hypothetical protein [Methylococcaceae bacterium]MDZ4156905.1 hypothetical protein [Methylococcales bacterium]MDP2394047.1 hypothetical protein [Methylococcaceae bacterium]MDP3018489.1 hypothetical protein [Methylococcaceae bacterium]MDP3390985.1 hypothetical protein [Methylococcaceae bacterium]
MKNKIILISLLMASSSVWADTSLLESAGKQTIKNAATAAAPKEAIEGVDAAGQTLEKAKDIKGVVETAPAAVQEQAVDTVKGTVTDKVEAATPSEVKQGTETVKKAKKSAKKLKTKVPTSTTEATKAVEGEAKEKAAEKALDLVK